MDVRAADVDLKRLGAAVTSAREIGISDFEGLLMLKGVGPRTLQSLTLVSEAIHGTPSRFGDPARFAFAHGGKNAKPFAVPTNVYDETIDLISSAVQRAKIGYSDKLKALAKLHKLATKMEKHFIPGPNALEKIIDHDKKNAAAYGARSLRGDSSSKQRNADGQLSLF